VLTPQAVKAATQLETTDVMVDPEEVQRFGAGALADELDDAERQAKVRVYITAWIKEGRGKRGGCDVCTKRRECHAARMLCRAWSDVPRLMCTVRVSGVIAVG
jgi:hypothetical protein